MRNFTMRNVHAAAFVSLDGVMQAPGGPEEDPTGGFELGGWTVNYWDDVIGDVMGGIFGQPYDLLLGRKTYEIFAAHWPYIENDPFAEALTNAKKYVVNASGRPVHEGGICQGGTTCVVTGQDRRLGDYLTNALDARGCVMIATGDTMSPDPVTGGDRAWSLPLFIMQNAGPSLTHGSCKSNMKSSSLIDTSGGERGPLAALGAALLLGAAFRRIRTA